MPDPAARLDSTHPLSGALAEAAEGRDEERFTSLVESALHEPDDTAIALLAPWLSLPGGLGRLAAHGLLMLGRVSQGALIAALEGDDPTARLHAAWALGGLGGAATVEALLHALKAHGTDEALLGAVFASLAELADRRAVPQLRAWLAEAGESRHVPAVLKAIGASGDRSALYEVAPYLRKEDPELRLRAAEAMVRLLDKRGWPVLFEILRGEDATGDSMVAAMRDLGDLTSALSAFVGDDQYQLRREAAEVLGTLGDAQAVGPLAEATRDINPWVRGAAAYALGRLGDKRALKPLIASTQDSSGWVRQCALRALGLLGDRRALKTLEDFMFDRDPDLASAAQEAMALLQTD
jgi:HEAT repeat protein